VCKKHRKFTGFTWRVLKKFKLVCQWTKWSWKAEFSNSKFTHVKLRAAVAKEKKPLEKHHEKNPKKESVQKT
jgi:hypothetical protein